MSPTTTKSVQGEARRGLVTVRRLLLVHGPGAPAAQVLDDAPLDLGREAFPKTGTDKQLSRLHATVRWNETTGSHELVDRDSHNGSFVGGARIMSAPLHDGAVLRLGESLFVYESLELNPDEPLGAETKAFRGPSLAAQRLRGELALVAPRSITVLVGGETGVGKEVAAEELHRSSGRSGAFVPVNCGAISAALAESELFGHEAGAFTGAQKKTGGLFAAAQRGTLFLDEVGELPLELQPKLLRALAKGEVRAVGSAEPMTVDVRVIAATHRDLSLAVASGTFRADLFARLSGWTVSIPPLRARRADVLTLANELLASEGTELSADAAEALLLWSWPYNVRELEQVVRAAQLRSPKRIGVDALPAALAAQLKDRKVAPSERREVPLEALVPRDRPPTRETLMLVLERLEGNVGRVADFFGKDRKQVYRWAEALGIDLDQFRD